MQKAALRFHSTVRFVVAFIGGMLVALGVVAAVLFWGPGEDSSQALVRIGAPDVIHELLDVEPAEARRRPYRQLRRDIERLIANHAPGVTAASVYYEDLATGQWVAVNGDSVYHAASLLKLPILILAHRVAETYPEIWEETLTWPEPPDSPKRNNDLDPKRTLLPGKLYTFREVVERMIVYSDNPAKDAAIAYLSERHLPELKAAVADLEQSLRAPIEDIHQTERFSVRRFSGLLRILYNASYLSPESSADALRLLRRSDFDRGIRGGVPEGVLVASKYGIRSKDPDGKLDPQLHECGIVYHDAHPYMLCIFSKVDDFEEGAELMRAVTSHVHQTVSGRD